MTGYQEILTDPRYHGQIVTMTYPRSATTASRRDAESQSRPWRGLSFGASRPGSNYRGEGDCTSTSNSTASSASKGSIPGRSFGDARARGHEGVLSQSDADDASLVAKAKASPGLVGRDLAREVMPEQSSTSDSRPAHSEAGEERASATARPHVVALDFGMKWNILCHLIHSGCRVTVIPGPRRPPNRS